MLINLFATGIKDYGNTTWHQNFTDDDYTITTNFQGGNCQSTQTSINITIVGKNQLKDSIKITVIMECHNEKSNEQTFTNKKLDCSTIKPISFLNDIDDQGIYYPIKNNDDSVTDLLLSNAKDDLNKFTKLDSPTINLTLHANFAVDDDNFQLDFQADIDPIIIKNADEIKLFTNCSKINNYKYVTNIASVIKYKDNKNNEQELKMNKVMNKNFSSNCQLTFNSISTTIKIKSFR
ncbi:hypothetical protein [Spiroplasma sp. AdecLV25b]|uniref:hypothetical protein n=1 Tax=Spiroplasma sp. AdecLV25b TaxID=3027162 RepID=UPI0027E13789|nr:hypothetical protein [Spiroplasma sp. AdecLV25b]